MYTLHWIGSMWTILRRTIHLNGTICTTSRCNFATFFLASSEFLKLSVSLFALCICSLLICLSVLFCANKVVQAAGWKYQNIQKIIDFSNVAPALKHPTDLCNNLPLLGLLLFRLLPSYLFICFFAFLSLNIKRLMRFLTPRRIENRQI